MSQSGSASVLVVDDEEALRKLVSEILNRAGYTVVEAHDGVAACDLVRQLDGDLDIVITDIRMPRMTGAELVQRLRHEYPHIKLLCMSGYADRCAPCGHHFLPKPFTPRALLSMVADVIGVDNARYPRTAVLGNPDDRARIQGDLRAKLVAAEARLEAANQKYAELMAIKDDVGATSDGLLALRQAIESKRLAFTEYSEAFRAVLGFTLGGPS